MLIYDVMCKFWIHLKERFEESDYLELPTDANIRYAIGTFHVRGHIAPCFYRYALTYMPGAGLIDGEILESLWSVLNHISPSARSASDAHREEILNDMMNHSNFKKLVVIREC
ncbi:hypothetical protein BDN72DRAFT_781174 [Pluteus cervinus]|uniref:Uncharacterized protein n=1 Tax=Pluteus cervinus TaxID=181527 RepID=A0ACD3A0I7_9AGAR|nr:hypothetical protein BDN72DRAFT_781174 [Pluteus cervinus]